FGSSRNDSVGTARFRVPVIVRGFHRAQKPISRAISTRFDLSPIARKKLPLCRRANQWSLFARPAHTEGRTRRHERWVRDAMDASASRDERGSKRTAKSRGPDPPTLGSSLARQAMSALTGPTRRQGDGG